MVNYHLAYYTFWSARMHIEQKLSVKCPNLRKHLENLLIVYGLNELQKDSSLLYDCGYFTSSLGLTQVIETMKEKFIALRPQVLNIMEGIDVPDSNLNSSIANYYGDIYE